MDLYICSLNEFQMWQEKRRAFDEIKGRLVSSDVLLSRDIDIAIERYDRNGNMFWKSWNDLSDYERTVWIVDWMATWYNPERYYCYEDYSAREGYFECEAVSPEGEDMAIFGIVGQYKTHHSI